MVHSTAPADEPNKLAIGRKGFRPFFLLAAMFAALAVPLWISILHGDVRAFSYLEPAVWHAHEMVFGFAVAVIAGFLLTAVGNWTGRETAAGAPLLGLAALWCLGRLALVVANVLPRGLPALLDVAFLPVLIVALARPLIATNNRKNLPLLVVLGALGAANVVVHLDALGLGAGGLARRACIVGIDVIVLLIVVISGRVLPMFTRNGTGATVSSSPSLDVATVASIATLALFDAVLPESTLVPVTAALAAVLAAARALHWGTWSTRRVPLLWILHLGCAWIPAGLALRALTFVVPTVPRSLGLHALTVGAIGSLCLGMMARVALGHTGRPLVAARRVVWAFGAVTAAAVVRLLAPIVPASFFLGLLTTAGILWFAAFGLFVLDYLPVLSRPRADGKAG